jgi:vancomycin permeability regulator SanA
VISQSELASTLGRWTIAVISAGLMAAVSFVGMASGVVARQSQGLVVDNVDAVPAGVVAIVPGTFVFEDGTPSPTLAARLDGARQLYQAGQISHILVSGDNSDEHYNEPVVMRNELVANGVPAADVSLDYAGLDTWDTCRRAVEQFAMTRAVVVTQRLYAPRTAALCRSAGLDVVVLAVDPPSQGLPTRFRLGAREAMAKVKALRDIVTTPPAKHGGPTIGLVGSVGMPVNGHPPDWNWETNAPAPD